MKAALIRDVLNWREGTFRQTPMTDVRLLTAIGPHETVTLVAQSDGTVAVQSPDGRDWLSIQQDGSYGWRSVDDPDQPGPWERFDLVGHQLTERPKDGATRPPVTFLVVPQGDDPPGPPVGRVGPLHVADRAFRDDAGQIVKYRGVTAFTALGDWLAGRQDKLARYADWSQGLGANTWRVFGMWRNTGLTPTAPGYYDGLSGLLSWLADRGLYLHFVLFCDQTADSPIRLSASAQDQHYDLAMARLDQQPTLPELVNEDWKNGDLAARFPRRGTVPLTRSSWIDGALPTSVGALLDWTTEHTPRDGEWPRKAKSLIDVARLGWAGWAPTLLPAVGGEPIRMDGQAPADYAAYAAIAELMGAGCCLHGGFRSFDPTHVTDLQNCVAPDTPNAIAVAKAVAEVWGAGIPADAAGVWEYTRGGLSNCPLRHTDLPDPAGALRTFAMMDGSRMCAVIVRPGPFHQVIGDHGWTPVRQVGPIVWGER